MRDGRCDSNYLFNRAELKDCQVVGYTSPPMRSAT
jgi:hypothetical protein